MKALGIADILGSDWTVYESTEDEDKRLKECDGYADPTVRKIVVDAMNVSEEEKERNCLLQDLDVQKKRTLRHEVIHAFLFESGLYGNSSSTSHWADNEEMVDYFAIQFPKIQKVFVELGVAWS